MPEDGDDFRSHVQREIDYVRSTFETRPLWGVVAAVHAVLDTITPSSVGFRVLRHFAPQKGRRVWLLAPDIYLAAVLTLSTFVLFADYQGSLGLQGILASLRLSEIVVVWLGVICRMWWVRDWSIYGVLLHGFQVVVLLAIIMRAYAPSAFVADNHAMGTAPATLMYVAFTNMTTRGNQFVPVTSGAELLTMISSGLGVLLFGTVLTAVIPQSRQDRQSRKLARGHR